MMLTSLPAGLFSHARFSDDAMLGNQLLQLFTRSQNADLLHWISFSTVARIPLCSSRVFTRSELLFRRPNLCRLYSASLGLEDPSVRSVKAEKMVATGATPTVELKTPLEKLFWLLSQFL
jgi:hypothetical protein